MTQLEEPRRYRTRTQGAGQTAWRRHHALGRERGFGLGRHVNHDPRSRRFSYAKAFPHAGTAPLEAIRHERVVPVFDQGEIGDCTANTALGLMGTDPYASMLGINSSDWNGRLDTTIGSLPFTQESCKSIYHLITGLDPFDGQWPPDDTGSDGLSMAKALVQLGLVPGYRHTFSVDEALAALQSFPLGVGTVWTQDMFAPNEKAVIKPTGAVDGGHEYIVDEYVPEGVLFGAGYQAKSAMVGLTSSWGTAFGLDGRVYMTAANFAKLLGQDGDVIVLSMPGAPAPLPAPAPDAPPADPHALAADLRAVLDRYGL